MATHRNPRRAVLAGLATLRDMVSYQKDRWTVRGTVYEPHIEDGRLNSITRKRRPDEYPENQVAAWLTLAGTMKTIQDQARAIEDEAHNQLARLRRDGGNR
jgi:hypothetical protein